MNDFFDAGQRRAKWDCPDKGELPLPKGCSSCYNNHDFLAPFSNGKRWASGPFFICRNDFDGKAMQLAELIEKTVVGLGFELVEFEASPRARLLRVFIDKPEGQQSGTTVDDCALVSSQLSRVFLVENVDYDRLEISSPGMDRPLVRPSDFRRFAGQEIQVKLRIPQGTQRNFSGVLEGLLNDSLDSPVAVLCIDKARHEFPLENIDRARLIPKF